ncbi:hypothetical protein ACL2XP_05625 [Sodalis sp. RH21]|uniref:hypothetical protein n=1 Tax=unclassified Sodalis (in: enterobacteria) TaxID=2636512 RepID=UPI0039B4EA8F
MGEPAWRIAMPAAATRDGWMAGRLAALAQAGFARQGRMRDQPAWFLVATGASAGDSCVGRMLIMPHEP